MAAKKKRPSTKKKTSGRASSGAKKRKASSSVNFPWKREVFLFALLAIAVLVFISNIGFGGKTGDAFRVFFFGVFGVIAYLFPFWLFFFGAFLAANTYGVRRNRPRTVMKSCAAVILLIALCAFAHLVCYLNASPTLSVIFKNGLTRKNGGGVLGGAVGRTLAEGTGLAGGFVIVIILLVLAAALISEKSFFDSVSASSRMAAKRAREQSEKRQQKSKNRSQMRKREKEIRRDRRREKELRQAGGSVQRPARRGEKESEDACAGRRFRRKVYGVSPDTKLNPDKAAVSTDNMSELTEKIRALVKEELSAGRAQTAGTTVGTTGGTAGKRKKSAPAADFSAGKEGSAEPQQTGNIPGSSWDTEFRPQIHLPEQEGTEAAVSDADPSGAGKETHVASAAAAAHKETLPEAEQPEETVSAPEKAEKTRRKNAPSDPADNAAVMKEINQAKAAPKKEYHYPKPELLTRADPSASGDSREHLEEMSRRLQLTLTNFGVNARVTDVTCGPTVTRYEIQPEMGVKVSKIVNLADDIKLNLAVADIRIEAPVPGKSVIGIEVPNRETVPVAFRSLVESAEFKNEKSKIAFCAGKDIAGKNIIANIETMPHLLIAGATGSGKSVCINTIIMSILYKASPDEVKMILIDPKVVELSVYNGIPHLLLPVVTDPKKAAGALNWGVAEMTDRYRRFAEYHVRDIKAYNQKVKNVAASMTEEDGEKPQPMPQILIVVDELADLMMAAPGDVEGAICRLAQLARACGIHLVIATQRPSVNVITGLIKANMPSRIAFSVTSGVDSRTILDMNGAEKLLGKGDMLFDPQNYQKPLRVQGAFVSDEEVSAVVKYIVEQNGDTEYDSGIEDTINQASESSMGGGNGFTSGAADRDVHFEAAGRFVVEKEKGSIGMLQRMFKVGFNRAARIMDQLEEAGVVGPEEGTKPRRVLMTAEEFEAYLQSQKQ
ncbi:MAG: DNA translocase FtsK [Lachnospiraceae bacterium]|jgi:S-DNA-T family DNA segregation ATPase FtsK/SpoIIIE|nr:DNA translocase FtsK [Lachnospiraceae bacterium]MCI1656665.1 DNA translocase FtsK [Lachnospiraceae bacterium]MCI2195327.1 DNA translocase FtsK [Lachnospiraceae bacterium]